MRSIDTSGGEEYTQVEVGNIQRWCGQITIQIHTGEGGGAYIQVEAENTHRWRWRIVGVHIGGGGEHTHRWRWRIEIVRVLIEL